MIDPVKLKVDHPVLNLDIAHFTDNQIPGALSPQTIHGSDGQTEGSKSVVLDDRMEKVKTPPAFENPTVRVQQYGPKSTLL